MRTLLVINGPNLSELIVSRNSRDSLDHLCGDLPLVDLLADERVAGRPLVLPTLEALQALVPDPQRLVLQVDLNVARHVNLGRLPNQDLWGKEYCGNPSN